MFFYFFWLELIRSPVKKLHVLVQNFSQEDAVFSVIFFAPFLEKMQCNCAFCFYSGSFPQDEDFGKKEHTADLLSVLKTFTLSNFMKTKMLFRQTSASNK